MRIIMLLASLFVFACSPSLMLADNEIKEPSALTQARKAYQAQANSVVTPIKKKYLAQLEELKKQLGGKGDLEGAGAVQKEIESLKDPSADAGRKNEVTAKLVVSCDDEFILAVNGKMEAKSTNWETVKTVIVKMQAGDIIAVKITDRGMSRGFACRVLVRNKEVFCSNTEDWYTYHPEDEHSWWNVKPDPDHRKCSSESAPVVDAVNSTNPKGGSCHGIWGDGNPACIYHVVTEKEMKAEQ